MLKKKSNIVSYKDKKVKLFLIFLLLSFFFWFLAKLSKEYTTTIPFQTVYVNAPKDKDIFTDDSQTIAITLKSSGFDLLKNAFKKDIKIDLSQVKEVQNKAEIDLNEIAPKLQEQLGNRVQILNITPEKLYFDFGKLATKKVKVIPNISLHYKSGYYLTEPLRVKPDSITISGPKDILDTIQVVNTEEIALKDVHKNFTNKLKLKTIPNKKIKLNTNKITVSGLVEKNTEGEIELPIFIINTNGVNVKTFEKSVKAKYKVSLKNYDKVKAKDFTIVCDFSKTKKDSLDYLIPEIKKQSDFVSEVEISPKRIEYLILK